MKTMKFRLLATIITLAAVITATTTPSNAQRRSSANNKNDNKVESTRTDRKSNTEKKSTFRENAKEPQSANHSVNNSRDVQRHNSTAVKEKIREDVRTASRSNENSKNKADRSVSENKSDQNNSYDRVRTENRTNYETKKRKSNSDKAIANADEISRRSTGFSTDNKRSNETERYNSNRVVSNNNSEKYNLNSGDARYKPNRDYKGSDKYWSSDFRTENRNNNHYKVNHDYNNYKHWDRDWESYRWNDNSWRNYYGFYDPYSYRNDKYYYHHNYYGHVIRKFVHRPQIYIQNHIRYYCYDGNFFRYRSGVGYVLVDIPFGMAFEYLPDDYERVSINGYLYFRVGNLFFEHTNYGFQLVHYPERYFAFADGYCNEGFHFND
jgi:hypothetical protein